MTSSSLAPLIDSDNLKRCSKCHEWKPREAFNRRKNASDGCRPECRDCQSLYSVHYYHDKRDRVREYHSKWYQANKEREKARTRAWVIENKEASQEYQRQYRVKKSAELREYFRQYKKANAESVRASNNKRRALKKNSCNSYTPEDLQTIRAAQTDRKGRLICWRCGKPIKGTPHLDHWIPLSRGGSNDAGNLHYMHARCNLTKNKKHPFELGRFL